MHRRDILKAGGAFALTATTTFPARAGEDFSPRSGAWRRYEVTTRLTLPAGKPAQAWVPLPSVTEQDWTRPLGDAWKADTATATAVRDPRYGVALLHLSWPESDRERSAEVTSRFEGRDRSVDPRSRGTAAALSAEDRQLYTAPTELIPTDGLVQRTAQAITAGAGSDLEKAQAIYDWVVEKTFRKASMRGTVEVDDVADMILLLGSEAGRGFHGACLSIDAGITAG